MDLHRQSNIFTFPNIFGNYFINIADHIRTVSSLRCNPNLLSFIAIYNDPHSEQTETVPVFTITVKITNISDQNVRPTVSPHRHAWSDDASMVRQLQTHENAGQPFGGPRSRGARCFTSGARGRSAAPGWPAQSLRSMPVPGSAPWPSSSFPPNNRYRECGCARRTGW